MRRLGAEGWRVEVKHEGCCCKLCAARGVGVRLRWLSGEPFVLVSTQV